MTKKKLNDYFTEPLQVFLTKSELATIAIALATESFTEQEHGRKFNAKEAWDLRYKIICYLNHI